MVSINRYNYEEYFLLYVDNELNAAEREQVESFVAENPDLEEEFTMLKQSQLKPDTSLVFEDKSALFKTDKNTVINLQNYETFFLLYVDEELSAEDRRAVERFASKHPAQQQELEILMQTRITPETSVVFPDKESLYRKAGSERVVAVRIWRMVAVAAMVIVAVGVLWLNSEKQNGTNPGLAKQEDVKSPNSETQVAPNSDKSSSKESSVNNADVSAQDNGEIKIAQVETGIAKGEKKNPSSDIQYGISPTTQRDDKIDAPVEEETSLRSTTMIAKIDIPQVEAKGSAEVEDNVLIIDQPYEQPKPNEAIKLTTAEGEPDDLAIGPVQTKNRLRGLFRRVTRVVEKNTHIQTSENKRLLIGNLEIALK